MEFHVLTELCNRLESESKRNVMIDFVAGFLKELNDEEVEPAVYMLLGRVFPRWDKRTLEISWGLLRKIIREITHVDERAFLKAFAESGDIGKTVETIFKRSKLERQETLFKTPLTILEVRRYLEEIAEASGAGSRERKERLLKSLLGRVSPEDAKYIAKVILGEMRTGFSEGLMEMAISKAFQIPLELVQKASLLIGDIGEVAQKAKTGGEEAVRRISFRFFRPMKPMLAQNATSLEEVLKEHGGQTALEYKLDGARIQIHKLKGEVKVFSRRLSEVTSSLPEVVELVSNEVPSKEVVLEGEVIAVGEAGNPLPFQHLMRRFRRIQNIEEMTRAIPIRLYLFDVLFLNGELLINKAYMERRRLLSEVSGGINLTKQKIVDNVSEAEVFFDEAVSEGHEGLVAKRLDSPYMPGIRGKNWFKIKRTLEPLDLVIVAAEYGYGRRYRWLSDYYLAARDPETNGFLIVGKTFKGLTDEEIEWVTERLKRLIVREEGRRVIVQPRIVVEVAYNEIQRSPKYKCGMALRFARITRIREDKPVEEADTIDRVREIYERQFKEKARYREEI